MGEAVGVAVGAGWGDADGVGLPLGVGVGLDVDEAVTVGRTGAAAGDEAGSITGADGADAGPVQPDWVGTIEYMTCC
ncbi:MAG TPA: hypothetical protein VM674_01745 [Candidatus Acidoferrum sp.]|nr:hypothetical protein [Candidatus Acidoferrum sp.]